MRPLQIISFFDGRPGHEKQTMGVVQALSCLTPTAVDQRLIERSSFKAGFINWLRYFAAVVKPSQHLQGTVDLIIGTGARTHVPMLLYKKKSGSKVITCMTPGFLFKRSIDLCLVPKHDMEKPAPNTFFTFGPPNNVVYGERHDPNKGLILIGGIDSKSHYWHTQTVIDQVRNILEKNRSVTWTITSSPRTPPETLLQLEKTAAENLHVVFIRSEDTESGWIETQYAQNSRVWVTADSVSMVYEALTAGCCVGVMPVQWKRRDNKFQRGLDVLCEKNQIILYQSWLSGNESMIRGAQLDEASRCAKEILRRWWPDRLK